YHASPLRMSSLPSLLTSATATPSERNTLSIWVFFQEMTTSSLSLSSGAATRRGAPRSRAAHRQSSQRRSRMGGTSRQGFHGAATGWIIGAPGAECNLPFSGARLFFAPYRFPSVPLEGICPRAARAGKNGVARPLLSAPSPGDWGLLGPGSAC